MKVVYTEQSIESLEESLHFLIEKQGLPPEKVTLIVNQLFNRAEELAKNPGKGQQEEYLQHLQENHRRIIVGYFNNTAENTTGKAPYPPNPRTTSGFIVLNNRKAFNIALTMRITELKISLRGANTKPQALRSSKGKPVFCICSLVRLNDPKKTISCPRRSNS